MARIKQLNKSLTAQLFMVKNGINDIQNLQNTLFFYKLKGLKKY